jgi:putative tRNA adenosine deaminase-associated protein
VTTSGSFSDVTAAEDWPLAREVLERLELPMPDEDDLDTMQPAGDLSVFADLGVPAMEVAMLCEDSDLYPDEMLDSIASRLGFGEEFRQTLDEGSG